MLLIDFSGINLVWFLYSSFVYQSLHFFLFFSFLPFYLSAHKRIFFFFFLGTIICQDKLCGIQDVKSDTTSAKDHDTCAH